MRTSEFEKKYASAIKKGIKFGLEIVDIYRKEGNIIHLPQIAEDAGKDTAGSVLNWHLDSEYRKLWPKFTKVILKGLEKKLKDSPKKNPAWRAGKAHGVAPTKKAAKAAASRARSKTRLRKEYVEGGPLLHNPKTLTPPFRHGQRVKVEVAREWIVSTGDKDLLKQFDKALKLQTKANRRPKTVEWQELSIGSPDKLDAVTAFVKYGTSAESVYQAPKGSKKGQDYYVHKWGEGSGKEKPVDLLVSADGKTMISPIGDGQIIDDWMRG